MGAQSSWMWSVYAYGKYNMNDLLTIVFFFHISSVYKLAFKFSRPSTVQWQVKPVQSCITCDFHLKVTEGKITLKQCKSPINLSVFMIFIFIDTEHVTFWV